MARYFLLFLFVFAISSTSSAATVVDENGAKALKSVMQDVLDYQKFTNEAFGDITMRYDGELQVVPAGVFYTVTLPRIFIEGKGAEMGSIVDVGIITINAAPADKPDLWTMTISLPPALMMTDKDGGVLTLSFGERAAAGVFNQTYGYFTKLDVTLNKASAIEGRKDIGLGIDQMRLTLNLDEGADKRLSGPVKFTISNFSIKDQDSAFTMGAFETNANLDRWMPVTLKDYQAKMKAHTSTFAAMKELDAQGNPKASPDAIYKMFSDLYAFNMNGLTFGYSLQDIGLETYSSPDEDNPVPTKTPDIEKFSMKNSSLSLALKGLEDENGYMALQFGYSGMDLSPPDPEFDDIMPRDVHFGINSEKLPVKSLKDLIGNTAQAAAQNPDMAAMAGMGLLFKLPAILAQNGTALNLEKSFVRGKLYETSIDGKIITDLTALLSFTGKINGVFSGLDALLKRLHDNANNPDVASATDYSDAAGILETIKGYGKNVAGSGQYTFAFEITKEGMLMLNGKEFVLPEQPPEALDIPPPPEAQETPQ